MLGFCALLVIRGLVSEVVLTRLPTGHTHEDIDAVFALIWELIKGKYAFTPAMYYNYILEATKSKGKTQRVYDIFVVPDFIKMFSTCLDTKLEHFAVEQYTQHQWKFTSVPRSSKYRDGVKITHCEYSSPVYCKITGDTSEGSILGLKPVNVESVDYPLEEDPPINILQTLPSGYLQPEGFLEGM